MNAYVKHALAAASRPIGDSPEWRRIRDLPRRIRSKWPEEWPDTLRKPGGALTHKALQSQALWELSQTNGLIGDMAVGTGKTLVALQAGVVLRSQCVVLLIPSSLKAKTARDIAYYGQHFLMPTNLHVVSYEALSLAKHASLLETLQPDLIVGDEAHCVARGQSTRTKRLRTYSRRHPECRHVYLSGTIITRSIRDVAKLSSYALGAGSPYPRDYQTQESWSWAVDDGVLFEAEPGVLQELCQPGEHVREGLRRRVRETLGVVGGAGRTEDQCPASLTFHTAPVKVPAPITKALKDLRDKWALPGGELLEDPLAKARAVEQLASGYYLRWIWPRGEPLELRTRWLRARSAWNTAVYHKLKHSSTGMDSPLLLYRAASSGRWAEPTWKPWADVRKECKPETEAIWISDFLLQAAVRWAEQHKGIVWVDSPEFGTRLADLSGLPYYGGGAKSDPEQEDGSRSCILSINAHRDGLNMQKAYGAALFTCIPRVAKDWEQAIGRIHRPWQFRDGVDIYLCQHAPELCEALEDARRNAVFLQQIQGSDSKLILGTWLAIT